MTTKTKQDLDIAPQFVPQSVEAEEAVVGSVIINPDSYLDAANIIDPKDFYIHRLGFIWKAISSLNNDGSKIDVITLADKLDQMGKLSDVGGAAELTRLLNQVPTSLHIADYANIIKDHSIKRNLILSANEIARIAYDDSISGEEALTKAEDIILARHGDQKTQGGLTPFSDVLKSFQQEIHKRVINPENNEVVIPTGFVDLDRLLDGGLWLPRVTILAGRPKLGKTQLWQGIATNMAKQGHCVALFSMEMPQRDLASRAVSGEAKLDESAMRMGNLDDTAIESFDSTIKELSSLPILQSDRSTWTTNAMRAEIFRAQKSYPLKVVFVDYIGLLNNTGYQKKEYEELSLKTRELKRMAKDFDVAIFAIHTLTADGRIRGGTGPQYEVDSALVMLSDEDYKNQAGINDQVDDRTVWVVPDLRQRYTSQTGAVKLYRSPDYPFIASGSFGESPMYPGRE